MATAKARYDALVPRRQAFVDRARECAKLTLPDLMPPEGHNSTQALPEPYQGFGARLVVSLSSQLLTAFFPPGRNFLKLTVSPAELLRNNMQSVPDDLEIQFAQLEQLIQGETERANWRQPTNLTLQLLIVTGNALEQMLPDNTLRVFRLDQYVCVRDPSGALLEGVIKEGLHPDSLDEDLKDHYDRTKATSASAEAESSYGTVPSVELYTHIHREGGVYKVYQEMNEEKIDGSEGEYAFEDLPFFFLRWNTVAGESYGRGKIEEHLADIRTFDGLSKSMRDGAAMASRNVTAIRPGAQGGLNLARKIAKANNGDMVIAEPDDIQLLNFANQSGLQVTHQELQVMRQELGSAFLMGASNARDAERVTATELRMVAQEIESVLGGVYAILSKDMMRSRVHRLMIQMNQQDSLPEMPEGVVEPVILTGLQTLSREHDVQSVMGAMNMLQAVPPEEMVYVKWESLLKQGFVGLGIQDAVRTSDEAQQERERRAQLQAAQDAVGKAAGPLARNATREQ